MQINYTGDFNFFTVLVITLKITGLVFLFMIVVEFLELKFSKIFKKYLTQNKFGQYLISSFLGATPGCVGVYAVDTFYMAGIIGFGGVVSATVSTFGDEAFVLFAASPKTALILVGLTFILGILAGYLADFTKKILNLKFKPACKIEHHDEHEENMSLKHFFKAHIWKHVFLKHIPKIFLWLFFSLAVISFLDKYLELSDLIFKHKVATMFIAALVGLLPISGPNLLFMTLYLSGSIPFSILLANSIIQDGHGLLPIMGYSIEDALKIKVFNIIFGLAIGLILLFLGY